MHSIYARINNTSAFLSSCLLALLGAIAVSSLLFSSEATNGRVAVGTIRVHPAKSPRYRYKQQDFTFVNYNLTADLTPLFNWNTKQVFLWVQAEYENAQGVRNEVVIWDRIVRRKEDANVSVLGKNKYVFRELSKSFKGAKPAHYVLKYNIMPHVGMLTYGEAARTDAPVPFPASQSLD